MELRRAWAFLARLSETPHGSIADELKDASARTGDLTPIRRA
jgi:hypothetical protein